MKKWFKKQHYLFWVSLPKWFRTAYKIYLAAWLGFEVAIIMPNIFR